ncbi:MAG TPA: SDR family oxidoreductase [Burkholderiales bacterium]|jgi:NAD(P)-dependent dehydrogenase (short-subunit alcohol dehydrogenase family)|nr:SDR family oxidoreductase [Burkholderiales bacterium]
MKLLEGDAALVTGAAGGIGRGIAAALEAEGARVLRADLSGCELEFDLSRPEGARALAAEAIRRAGRLSILVHAASPKRQESQTALAVTDAQWREMLAVNLDAAFILAQTLGLHMKEHTTRGRILVVTSLHAETPRNLPHYSAAKAGQTMLVKELARALGPHGIRVNAIVPGAIPGGGFNAPPGMVEKIPLRRFGTPADVAAMAVAVLSERFGAYVTGASIVVDGGIALHNWIDPS